MQNRGIFRAFALGATLACASLSHDASANEAGPATTATAAERPISTVEYGAYQGAWFGAYLAPASDFIDADGGVDLVFHFHGAMMAEKSWRQSGANAVIASQAFAGFGSGPYEDAFADRGRFDRMISDVLRRVGTAQHREHLHARRITLVGWSAGCAAVASILGVPRYFAMVDSVVLLDGLHTQYKLRPGEERHAKMGVDHVRVELLDTMKRFASEAMEGRKQMIVTHTSIVPPDYASTTETADALVRELHLENAATDETLLGMHLRTRAHKKNLYVLGFSGAGPEDHMKHLYVVGDAMRTWVAPRLDALAAEERQERTQHASR